MLDKHVRSFGYAWQGIRRAWREEVNFRVEVALGVLALGAACMTHLTRIEWALFILASALVLAAEVLNTALEELCDMLRPTHDPHVGKIKDLAAGATLIAATGAFVIGLVIFLPHFI